MTDLTPKQFVDTFISIIKNKATTTVANKELYFVRCDDQSDINVYLNAHVFSCDNIYLLWLTVYEFMLRHSQIGYSKKIYSCTVYDDKIELDCDQDDFVDESETPYDMANYNKLIEQYAVYISINTGASMESFVDFIVNRFSSGTSTTLWAKKVVKVDDHYELV